ncbi:MAG: hypothetical protein IPK07_18200 [Deltaproteobacteria bacterium]|nr:hypothetical protein [Deltaproteobacteria bacterium]
MRPRHRRLRARPDERWTSFLPFVAEEAKERGYGLPAPFGFGMIYNYLARDIRVDDVRLAVNGGPGAVGEPLPRSGLNSRVNAAIARLDAWLLRSSTSICWPAT